MIKKDAVTNRYAMNVPAHAFRALATGAGFCALLASAGCTDQPKNRCKVAPGLAVARYTPQGAPSGNCTNVALPGKAEAVGMQAFVPDPTQPNASDTATSFTIKPQWLGERIAEARDNATQDPALSAMKDALTSYPYASAAATPPPTDITTTMRPYAFGTFATVFPGDNGICTAAAVNASDLSYPTIPAHTYPDPSDATKMISVPETPAAAVKYQWSNVRVIQIPSSPGTQTFADLTVTRDGCSATFQAAILVPKVGCGKMMGTTLVADITACDPNANTTDPTSTNIFGSGISQGVPTECLDISGDPMSPDFVCVPTKTAP